MAVNSKLLTKAGGGAAIVGGSLRVASAFVPYKSDTLWLEMMYAIIDYSLLVGMSAIYLRFANQLGVLGLLTFCVITIGLSSIVGPDTEMFGVDFYQLGAGVIVSGLAILSAQLLICGMARVESSLWILSFLLSVCAVLLDMQILLTLAGVLFGLAFVISGRAILRQPLLDDSSSDYMV